MTMLPLWFVVVVVAWLLFAGNRHHLDLGPEL